MRHASVLSVILTCVVCSVGCSDTSDDDLTGNETIGESATLPGLQPTDVPPGASNGFSSSESPIGAEELLCTACTASSQCGGTSNYCLQRTDGVRFCGRDCRASACPSGYTCTRLSTTVSQCIPPQADCARVPRADAGTPTPTPDAGPPPSSQDAGTASGDVPSSAYCSPIAGWQPAWATLENEVLRLTNEYRRTPRKCGTVMYGSAPALTTSPALRCAARLHAKDMQDRNYFDHTTLGSGQTFDQRITAAGYSWRTAGENIAFGYRTAQLVVDGWIASPGHCQNLMNPAFTQLGVGFYDQNRWVQDFGAPL